MSGEADDEFEPDSLRRLRLIQFVRSRGIGDEQLAAVTASQGDLLGVFEQSDPPDDTALGLVEAARNLDLDDGVIAELAEILGWDDAGSGTESDVAVMQVVAQALALGMPHDALMQLIRVFTDTMDRLADAQVRTFHDYVHERFGARGLVGRELLDTTQRIGRPMLNLAEPALVYFY
ncbi:MAG TPA: adenylate cyclase, partial [Mycobacterium sp.]|nr:adenylate cyclase [Mycobacterium sp.]